MNESARDAGADIDRNSRTWRAIQRWAAARIEKYRDRIEIPETGDRETQELRGRIAELRAMTGLTDETTIVAVESVKYDV